MIAQALRRVRSCLPGIVALLVVGGPMLGCVSQQQYDQAVENIRALESMLAEAQEGQRSAQLTIDRQGQRLRAYEGQVGTLQGDLSNFQAEAQQMQGELEDLNQRFQGIRFSTIDPAASAALRSLAAARPDLVIYDDQQGMLRFASDLTFNSGSAVVQARAQSALSELARVLLRDASAYDIRVVGHTDSQRPSNPNTLRNHPTNRHLSVHRAIAVSEVLQRSNVPADRIEVAGWGAQRPIVPNNPTGGTAQNRRVEIFVVPRSARTVAAPAGNEFVNPTPTNTPGPVRPNDPIIK